MTPRRTRWRMLGWHAIGRRIGFVGFLVGLAASILDAARAWDDRLGPIAAVAQPATVGFALASAHRGRESHAVAIATAYVLLLALLAAAGVRGIWHEGAPIGLNPFIGAVLFQRVTAWLWHGREFDDVFVLGAKLRL